MREEGAQSSLSLESSHLRTLRFWAADEMAIEREWMLVAGPVGGVAWIHLADHEIAGSAPFDVEWDLDVHEGRALIPGVRRTPRAWAPDGGIAWFGSLQANLGDLRILHRAATGPGADKFNRCGSIDLTRGAFLQDGSMVVVPGVEDGVFQYSPLGRLERSWTSAQLGLDADCSLSDAERHAFAENGRPRERWLNQRRVVDSVIADPDGGCALLRRDVRSGLVHWDLLRVDRSVGQIRSEPTPFFAPAGAGDQVRAIAAAYGRRIAVLPVDLENDPQDSELPRSLWVGTFDDPRTDEPMRSLPGAKGPPSPPERDPQPRSATARISLVESTTSQE